MKLNEHARARPNIAGLTSQVQQAEMTLILAGRWPALKPLPVFKYETDEYRASIDFDKTRGEWVCRKISFPSNKVQELRGGLTEMTMALPHGRAGVLAECAATEQQEQELEKDANRRLQAILEWRENYESGALYSELQGYLSESQRDEIDESIRLSLTARQLQFNPKNVAFVFDALSKAGGRLATLIEIAQRNKMQQEGDAQSQGDAGDSVAPSGAEISTGALPQSLEASFSSERAENFAPEAIKTFIPALGEGFTPAPVESLIPATVENFPTEPIGSVFPEQDQRSSPELIAHTASEVSEIVMREILDASPRSLVEDFQEKAHRHTAVTRFRPQVRTYKVEPSTGHIKNSPFHFYVLKISRFQVAALLFLSAVISLTVGLAVGRGPLGKRLPDTQKSILAVDATSPAPLNRPGETTSRTSTTPAANTFNTPAVNPPATATAGSRSESPSAQSLKAVGSISGAPRNSAPRRVTPATTAAPHPSPSSAILVTGPGNGSKPFRLILPEKPIAASSSFAMTSQLSVLVSPEPGPAPAHKPARLEAGQLVSFVWPRYPRPGDRHGSSETVKVRTTIGELGQVLDVKHVSGSISLLPAAMSAIRLWRYKPTLLNHRPVQAQQDVTIEFRPPQYLARVSTRHPSHN